MTEAAWPGSTLAERYRIERQVGRGGMGTPPDRKRFVVAHGVHYVPRTTLIRETLDWLDRFLGPVQ